MVNNDPVETGLLVAIAVVGVGLVAVLLAGVALGLYARFQFSRDRRREEQARAARRAATFPAHGPEAT